MFHLKKILLLFIMWTPEYSCSILVHINKSPNSSRTDFLGSSTPSLYKYIHPDYVNGDTLTLKKDECVVLTKTSTFLKVMRDECVAMFESNNCGRNGKILQFRNGPHESIKINTEAQERIHGKFNLKPLSFQSCKLFDSCTPNSLPGKYCASFVVQLFFNSNGKAQAVKNGSCVNLGPSHSNKGHLTVAVSDSQKSAESLCIEVYSENNCKGYSVQYFIPLLVNQKVTQEGHIKIWDYFYGGVQGNSPLDISAMSVKGCSLVSQQASDQTSTASALNQNQCPFLEMFEAIEDVRAVPLEKDNYVQICRQMCGFRGQEDDYATTAPICSCIHRNPNSLDQLKGENCPKRLIIFDDNVSTDDDIHEQLKNYTESQNPMFKCEADVTSAHSNQHRNTYPYTRCSYVVTMEGIKNLRSAFGEDESNPTQTKKDLVEIMVIWIAGSLAAIMLIVVLILSFLLWKKKKRVREVRSRQCIPRRPTNTNSERVLNVHQVDPIEQNDYEDDITGLHALCRSFAGAGIEIPRENIDIGNIRDSTALIIGVGEFSIVFKGRLRTPNRLVAVKTMKSCQATPKALKSCLRECQIFMQLGTHERILEFIGVCTESARKGEVFILMEFCAGGSLGTFLIQQRSNFVNLVKHEEILNDETTLTEAQNPIKAGPPMRFNTFQLFKWCWEVADAMEFLAVRKVVHMSLCTKNVLLDSNFSTKLSDFYFARTGDDGGSGAPSSYFNRANTNKDRLVPWRWFAIESLLDDIFSIESDIWAFGVFMWEIFTLGATPYPEYAYGGEFTLCIKHGYRLLKPEFATLPSYELMLLCWYDAPEKRPPFTKVKSKLATMVPKLVNG